FGKAPPIPFQILGAPASPKARSEFAGKAASQPSSKPRKSTAAARTRTRKMGLHTRILRRPVQPHDMYGTQFQKPSKSQTSNRSPGLVRAEEPQMKTVWPDAGGDGRAPPRPLVELCFAENQT